MKIKHTRFVVLFLTLCLLTVSLSSSVFAASSNYYKSSKIKASKNVEAEMIAWKNGQHKVTSFGQSLIDWNLKGSGCGYCCAATVVRLYGQTSTSYKKTPINMYIRAKKLSKSNPLNLGIWGMANLFDYFKVPYKLYYSYPFESQPDLVYNHLKKGGMAVMWTCKAGMGNYPLHSVVLCGLDEKGNVIVANSANNHKRFETYTKGQIWDHMRAMNRGNKKYYKYAFSAGKVYWHTYTEVADNTQRGVFLIG